MVLPMVMGGGVQSGYTITNSARFNGTSAYLQKTLTTSTTTSGSVWVKRSKLGAVSPIFDNKIYFTSGDALYAFGLTSTALYSDPSAWMHIFWNGTGVYVNGTLVTGTGSYTAASITNPRLGYDGTNYFSGYMADFAFWNGTSASLQGGATDSNGVWAAKRPSAGYSFLAFGSSGALGTDTSGNGNNWTATNVVQTIDTPTNNHATWNPLDMSSGVTLSVGNTGASVSALAFHAVKGTIQVPPSGGWVFEFSKSSGTTFIAALGTPSAALTGTGYNGANVISWFDNGDIRVGGVSQTVSGTGYSNGNVCAIHLDRSAATAKFYVNGSLVHTLSSVAAVEYVPAFWLYAASGTVNFGQAALSYAYGTAKALCTANLPAVAIPQPKKHFNVKLYTGTGSARSLTGLGFQPDWLWVKIRSASDSHVLADVLRGATTRLSTNLTTVEATNANYIASFDSDGFSVGTDGSTNLNTGAFSAWAWKAGGSGVSNTDGTITSNVSANPTAGFSVVAYTGTGSNGTVGHGLGATPGLVISFCRNNAGYSHLVYHRDLGNTKGVFLDTNGAAAPNSLYWNNTSPTSTVVTVGGTGNANVSNGASQLLYCFAEIPGYSKFGSYTGNSSSDGPFVYCGFCPRWVLLKASSTTGAWILYDTLRSTYNACGNWLSPNLANAEASAPSGLEIDILSNGFKLRNSDAGLNGSGSTYIYAAFAEFPFGGSNVAPSPAR